MKYFNHETAIIDEGCNIGEGTKTQELVRIVNSDERVIVVMISWFKKFFNLDNVIPVS